MFTPMTWPRESHQRPARVARVQRRVGLDDVVDQPPRLRAQRAAERADHAGGHRAFEAVRVADGDGELADAQLRRVAERDGGRDVVVHADDGEIGVRIVADEVAGHGAPVGEA